MKGFVMSYAFRSHLLIGNENDIEGGYIPHNVRKLVGRDAIKYVRLVEYLEKGIVMSFRG